MAWHGMAGPPNDERPRGIETDSTRIIISNEINEIHRNTLHGLEGCAKPQFLFSVEAPVPAERFTDYTSGRRLLLPAEIRKAYGSQG